MGFACFVVGLESISQLRVGTWYLTARTSENLRLRMLYRLYRNRRFRVGNDAGDVFASRRKVFASISDFRTSMAVSVLWRIKRRVIEFT